MVEERQIRAAPRAPSGLRADVNALVREQELRQENRVKLHKLNVLVLCLTILIGVVLLLPSGPSPKVEPPRSEEARTVLGAMKDRARQIHRRNPGLSAVTMKDLDFFDSDLNGTYFHAGDYTCGGTPESWWAECHNVYSAEPRHLRLECNLKTGEARFNR